MRLLAVLALAMLLACTAPVDSKPGTLTDSLPMDADADGFLASEDCDDLDDSVNPSRAETCDGRDEDCDGETDEEPTDGTVAYADADGDGRGDPAVTQTACELPAGYVAVGDDCDDTDASRNPSAIEACDQVDNDCDGATDEDGAIGAETWYADLDGDGFGDADAEAQSCDAPDGFVGDATDCDDASAAAHPGAIEVCDDVLDNDCDGTPSPCGPVSASLSTAIRYLGEGASDYAAFEVAAAGDIDADGFDDLLIGGYRNDDDGPGAGAAYLVRGCAAPASASLSTAIEYRGKDGDDAAGSGLAGVGDVDGDGFPDLLVGGYGNGDGGSNAGAAWLVRGSASPTSGSLAAAVQYTGQSAGGYAGSDVAAAGDVDGDGRPDLLIGAPYGDFGGRATGAAYLVLGSASPESANLSTVIRYAGAAGDGAGYVAGLGDVDGDGLDDLAIGAPLASPGANEAGATYLVLGGAPASASLGYGVLYAGEAAEDHAGFDVARAGDVNGDGHADLLIGAYNNDDGGHDAGAAYLALGGAAPASASLGSAVELMGDSAGDKAGISVDGAGDVDGDGHADLLIGAYLDSTGAASAGAAYLVLGSASPAPLTLAAAVVYSGTAAQEGAGRGVAGAGDVDGDGHVDVLVGAYRSNAAATEAGAAYLVLGTGI